MDSITFKEIMDFYPAHNRSVYEDLKNDFKQGCLIPFVGAGLSVFCGYSTWPHVLEQLSEFIYDENVRADIRAQIKSGELLQAAQEIQQHYPRILRELAKIIDYNKIKNCDIQKIHASAAYILPYLFRSSLVITTNFDRVLEEVYDRCRAKFGKVVTPFEPDLLTQIRQGSTHCLFKLHGDIGPETYDMDRLIFTQTQYDTAYHTDGPLMRELPQWFRNKKLLFLGCSLEKDKTMEVLQQVTAKNPGLNHYAILECSPDAIGRRCIEMGGLGISPIYFPSGKFEAVRVILERLLEETTPDAYTQLKRDTGTAATASDAERRFMYDSDYIAFTGRKRELEQLHAFCASPALFSWWAVTGPGGIGKSRLVHEFTKTKQNDGWEICWLKYDDYNNLRNWTPPVDRTIVVADDIQPHLQMIGNWLISVSGRPRSEKLRLLLLEREGKNLDSARWAEMMQTDFPYDNTIPSRCYRPDFLQPAPLSEEELKTIMANYAAASDKPLKNKEYADRLLHTLQKIDNGLQRPIYALAIADAWCNGKDPTRWDKEQILDALVRREMNFYFSRLHSLSSGSVSKTLRSELENILARSCPLPFLPLELITDQAYPALHMRADKLEMDFHELLRLTGVVRRITIWSFTKDEDGSEREIIPRQSLEAVILDCPDLIKEYLVLQQAFDRRQLSLLLPDNWDNNPRQLYFLRQLLIDYPEKLEEKNQFWETFFAGNPKSDFSAGIYGDILTGITALFSKKWGEQANARLKELHRQFQDNESIATSYADGLFNSTAGQSLSDCERIVEKIGLLYEMFRKSEDLAAIYAKSLVNLAADQSLPDCVQTVDKLRLLHERFPANETLTVMYAEGLVNLTIDQSMSDRKQTIDKLRFLHDRFRANEELTVAYAKGLVNLAIDQPSSNRKTIADKLRLLYETFQANAELAIVYASGLINLDRDGDQPLSDRKSIADKLKLLHEAFQTNEELADFYISGLAYLSFAQTTEADVRQTLKQSERLAVQYPKNDHMQMAYAATMFNLTLVQSPAALGRTVDELRRFLLKHPGANKAFQIELDTYLHEHPDHTERYAPLRL